MAFQQYQGQFPYKQDGGTFRPLIPVRFANPSSGAVVETDALVDTGADTSLITYPTLLALGFDPALLESHDTVGTGGAVRVYRAEVILDVCGIRIRAPVVAPVVEGLTYHLLGRTPLFQHVHFAFEEYAEPWRNRILWKLP